ncbi:hypothetical protein DEO72_LG2g1370 [Vigna unguiculata]|uniref:Uncharacterized protein n=1 Tax=Vigna unguiculata TaxID=3917 RepID=A0A4D6KSM5_VIGUN|nr:hypothetical protein DEO72_LG2g1370 [Vigna unguiculata]
MCILTRALIKTIVLVLEPQPPFTSARVPTFFRFAFRLGHCSAHCESGSRAVVLLVLCRKTCTDPFPGESRARPGNLAQASRTRLSESGGGSPKPFSPKVAQTTSSFILRANRQLAQARGISPKRDPVHAPAPFLSPRLGEEGLA